MCFRFIWGFEGGWVVLDHIPIFTPVRTTKLSTTTVPSKPTPYAESSKGLARYSNLTQCDILWFFRCTMSHQSPAASHWVGDMLHCRWIVTKWNVTLLKLLQRTDGEAIFFSWGEVFKYWISIFCGITLKITYYKGQWHSGVNRLCKRSKSNSRSVFTKSGPATLLHLSKIPPICLQQGNLASKWQMIKNTA